MFDLQFYRMISKCTKLLLESCSQNTVRSWTRNTAKDFKENVYDYVIRNKLYINKHIEYFNI